MTQMRHLLQLALPELEQWLRERGQPPFRARQIRRWIFAGRATSFDDMTDLPQALRGALATEFTLWQATVVSRRESDDGSEKLLLQWPDGGRIECVLLREASRRSICISTQVGCAMGCVFCASGLDGVDRNLTSGEILEQCLLLRNLLPPDERLSHVIVMGMGEPLANHQQLLAALEHVRAAEGLGVSARRITISTVGLPAAMDRLTETGAPYHLAVSLHAPNDELRTQLVPVNRQIGLQPILEAADRFFARSGRRLTYEYVLLADINDQPHHARQLAELLRGRNALLNVIPYNPVAGLPYRTPSPQAAARFREILEHQGLNVRFRKRKGSKIDAACGQLRRSVATGAAALSADATSPAVEG
jgi:23S rRNA (adenine2503-C2)-methyltransferase